MPAPILKRKAAALDGHGDLDFVLRTTTTPSHERDSINDLYHTPRARRKP